MAKILVVDDAAFMRMRCFKLLTEAGHEVIEASNGAEAVEKYQEMKPDGVLLDITMPKMDGIATLEKILEFDDNAIVIMISALGKENLVKEAIMLGAKNYIIKPIDRNKVLERIGKILQKL